MNRKKANDGERRRDEKSPGETPDDDGRQLATQLTDTDRLRLAAASANARAAHAESAAHQLVAANARQAVKQRDADLAALKRELADTYELAAQDGINVDTGAITRGTVSALAVPTE